jgi:cell pole-organizing protein PopZ
MEEILASIRRIISEDEPAAEAAPEAAPVAEAPPVPEPEPEPVHAEAEPEDDVLELTQVAPLAEPEPEPVHEPDVVETHGDIEVHAAAAEPEPEPAPVFAAPAPEPVSSTDEDPLMSDTPATAASSAFGHLAHTVTMPADGRVLEDVVRELLRPLLKAWLDEHLPMIVQAKVDEEVARIARRRVG